LGYGTVGAVTEKDKGYVAAETVVVNVGSTAGALTGMTDKKPLRKRLRR
jgi:hypothetical protein